MIVTHKMVLDMEQAGEMLRIDAVQDDRYTRNVELTLTAGGLAWDVPETASVVVRYRKADGIGGQYDALPDGSRAWNAVGNVVTVALAPQMLTVPGPVTVSVGFLDEEREINTFCFLVNVQTNAGAQIAGSEPYYHVRNFLPQPEIAAAGQFLQITGVNDQGVITRVTAVDAPIGEPGENGGTYTPAVSADGVLSWTNDKGLPDPAPVSIRGPEGPAGPQGAAAVSPVARVAETEAGVEIRITDEFGTSKATVLHGKDGAQGEQGPQGPQGIQGETGRTPGIWLAPEDDSAFVLQYGVVADHLVGTVAASADTVFAGDMILCSNGGVVLVEGFDENDSDWVLCQGAKDEADLTAGAAVSLKGTDGKDGNLIWLTEDSTDSVQMDGVYFTHLTGAKDATMETVLPGDLLITVDGDLMRIKSVMELSNDSLGVAMVGGNVISLKGADGTSGADGTGGGTSTTVVTVGFANCDFICDGVDDDVEILAAINSLPDGGGTVKLAAGDYYLSSTIASAKNNVRIVGEVNSTTTLISSNPSVNLHGSKTVFNPSGWNWQFSEISFLGENAVSYGKSGVSLQNAKGSNRVERCFFSGWYNGIEASNMGTNSDALIHGCTVAECTYGIQNPGNATVTGCIVTNCDYGIEQPSGCAICGNTILDCGIGIGPIDAGKNTITGNTITRGNGTAADYSGEQHTILLGYVDLDNTTMLYGYHNCITGNFLHGKDVTIETATTENGQAELDSCIVRNNLASEIPFFDLAAVGLPAVPADETTVSVEADYSAILAALSRGPVKFRVLANLGTEFTVEFVASGTTVVGAGTGVAAMMYDNGMVLVFCMDFSGGTIQAYGRVLVG